MVTLFSILVLFVVLGGMIYVLGFKGGDVTKGGGPDYSGGGPGMTDGGL